MKKKKLVLISPLKRTVSFVAYLDILGFTEMLASKGFATKIARVVKRLQSRAEFDGKHHPTLRYLAISDTIIITADKGDGFWLIRKICQVQTALLKAGFATRGAVSFGPLLTYEGDIGRNIFGKTYLQAYEAEQRLAFYPRVVVLDDAHEEIRADHALSSSRNSISTYILTDLDGVRFVNQFSSDVIGLNAKMSATRRKSKEHCELLSDHLDIGLSNSTPRGKLKWQWLQNQFHTQLDLLLESA